MCRWSTKSVLVGKTETVPGVRKHTLKQSSDMKQVSVIKCEVIVMGKFPFYRNLGVSLQGGDTLAVIWCQRRVWSRRDQHTQWPWKWARISVALDLTLKPCEDTEAIYPKRLGHYWKIFANRAVGLGEGAGHSSAPLCGASGEIAVSCTPSAQSGERTGFGHGCSSLS